MIISGNNLRNMRKRPYNVPYMFYIFIMYYIIMYEFQFVSGIDKQIKQSVASTLIVTVIESSLF